MKIKELSYTILTQDNDFSMMLKRIERAGRTCYRSEDRIDSDSAEIFVKMLINLGHEAVLEHAPNISVLFHVNRGVTHELVRHRLASFSQASTRYCNYSKGKFGSEITVIPMLEGLTGSQIERRKELYRHVEEVYMKEVEEGIKPQQARDNLTICTQADIVITTNVRHWREIFRQRTTKFAHPQMRTVMRQVLQDFRRRVNVLFDDVGEIDA